jgi:hypothetical protein
LLALSPLQDSPPARRPIANRLLNRACASIYRTARSKELRSDRRGLLWCLYASATSRDPALARLALARGRERAAFWQREHPALPSNASADALANLLFGAYAAEKLGLPDERLKEQIRRAAPVHPVEDYLAFDPTREPPPADVPNPCRKCSKMSPRGATFAAIVARRWRCARGMTFCVKR